MIPASTTLTSTMIPDELRQRQQWVVWKADKHPYDAKTGEAASSTDPTTWATYEQAVRAAENGGQYRGIGYVFSEDDGITGIDLDNCIDGKGVLEPWAQQIVSDLRSYTEVSPSGRGLHILSRGQLPGNGRNFGQVEMYDQGRYFCTTGKHLDGTPVDIRERSEAVTKLYTQLDARKRQENSKSQDKKYVVPAVSGRTPYGQAALVAELKNVASAPVDTRNTTLNCAAFSLGQLVASGDLAQHEVEGGLLDAAKKAGLPTDEVNITIRSGLESGKREPRSVPVNVSAGASSHANQENPEPGLTKMLGDHFAKENHFACEPDGTLYVFRCGVYQPQGDRIVKRAVKHTLERWGRSKEWSKHRANEVLEYISIDSPELWQRPLLDMINLSNGLLDVENRELRQHDPNFLSPVQLPIVYDPRAQCPEWETFIGQVFPADAQELPWELVAWLMLPDTTLQKAILLLGEGANGKSTFLAALGTFLGRRNTVALSLHKLESDRFAAVRLAGKLANICPDLPSAHLASTDVFKRITDGTEPITAERKFHGSYDLHCYARLIFSANHPPRSPDASHAFFRRWLVVPFSQTFDPADQIRRDVLDARLSNPRELSGVLNRALDALPRLRERGLTESVSMQNAWNEFRESTDPVAVWLDTHTLDGPDLVVSKKELFQAYSTTARSEQRATITSTAFGKGLKRLRPGIQEAQRTMQDKVTWVWLGIGLRNDV